MGKITTITRRLDLFWSTNNYEWLYWVACQATITLLLIWRNAS